MRLVMLLTIPSAIGLIILAEPIIRLIYQHGRFTADATTQTAAALRFYAIGLAGYAGVKVLAPAFYAINKRHLPMVVSLLSIAVNFGLNWFFTFHLGLGHRGLALSTSFVAMTNFLLLYAMMRRHTGRLETGAMLATLGKIALAGAVLAVVCLAAQQFLLLAGSAWFPVEIEFRGAAHDRRGGGSVLRHRLFAASRGSARRRDDGAPALEAVALSGASRAPARNPNRARSSSSGDEQDHEQEHE